MKRLKNNDGKAFDELFRRYYISLREYAMFYTNSPQQAEDIVHDFFYGFWEKRKDLKIHTSVKSYFYRSIHNNCIQYLRHQKVIKRHNYIQQVRLDEALIINKLYLDTGLRKLFETEINELVY